MNFTIRQFEGLVPLCYADSGGSGPTLLLLHGVTRCGADWEPILPKLTTTWRVISLDQRGHGGSARAEQYLVTDYIADAIRFVSDEVAGPLIILGHSLGAMVAAAVAAELPQLVRGIVLEDPPFHTMGNRIAGSSWQALFIGMKEATLRGGSIAEITELLADIRLPVSCGRIQRLGDLRDRDSLAWSAACLSQLDPEVLTPVIEGRWLEGFHVDDVLSRVRCPALLLHADPTAGGALTNADADTMMAKLAGGQHVRFPSVGHQIHRDCTDAVFHELHRFMVSVNSIGTTTEPTIPMK